MTCHVAALTLSQPCHVPRPVPRSPALAHAYKFVGWCCFVPFPSLFSSHHSSLNPKTSNTSSHKDPYYTIILTNPYHLVIFNMATSYSRHAPHYPVSGKGKGSLPVKIPSSSTSVMYPSSRAAMSPPEYPQYSDSGYHTGGSGSSRHSSQSTSGRSVRSGRSSSRGDYDYDDCSRYASHDPIDMLTDRMNSAFDPITMDRSLVKQAQE
jgi:hypothetical protein